MHEQRPIKRSRKVALTTLIAASAFSLQACGTSAGDWSDANAVDAYPYASVAQCAADGRVPEQECREAYNQALADDSQSAPRFDSLDLCEDQFGTGQCQQRVAGGGSFWTPLLAGFLISEVVDEIGDRRRYRRSGLYRDRRRDAWYSGGGSGGWLYGSGGRYQVGANAIGRPVAAPRVQSRSNVVSRGGLGSRASSGRGGWGG